MPGYCVSSYSIALGWKRVQLANSFLPGRAPFKFAGWPPLRLIYFPLHSASSWAAGFLKIMQYVWAQQHGAERAISTPNGLCRCNTDDFDTFPMEKTTKSNLGVHLDPIRHPMCMMAQLQSSFLCKKRVCSHLYYWLRHRIFKLTVWLARWYINLNSPGVLFPVLSITRARIVRRKFPTCR